jgi:hypothetical protein
MSQLTIIANKVRATLTIIGTWVSGASGNLLLEIGDNLLLENGDNLNLEG